MTPYRWDDKDPSDAWPYGFDFTAWCAAAGETAASVAATVSPSGLTIGATSVTAAGMASVLISGGTAGTDYAVRLVLTTAAGRTLERTVMIKVRDL